MNELIRHSGMDPLLDDMFRGFWVRPFPSAWDQGLSAGIRLDLKEDDKAYTLHAEIPGVSKDDIQVEIEGNRVSIRAEVKKESEQKEGEKVIRSERYYGEVSRIFTLDQDVDQASATAKYKDGVLELSLPKKAPTTGHKLSIE